MSETTASLRRKISSAEDLQSVVRTMKVLSASSIGQYEKSVAALNDYYRAVELGLSLCMHKIGPVDLKNQAKKNNLTAKVGAIVFGSDQGLVGQFNEVLVDYVSKKLAKISPNQADIWAVGERIEAQISDTDLHLLKRFSVPNTVKAIAPLVEKIRLETETRHSQGEIAELYLFYNSSANSAAYAPVSKRLLPLDANFRTQLNALKWPKGNLPRLVGEQTTILHKLIGEYLFVSLFRACAESLASENASRLAAMQRADKNIDELLISLNSSFHRLRQSGIDEELFDVLAGFEALN
jgi:F-type H+-transporting ATPase subunit gamma